MIMNNHLYVAVTIAERASLQIRSNKDIYLPLYGLEDLCEAALEAIEDQLKLANDRTELEISSQVNESTHAMAMYCLEHMEQKGALSERTAKHCYEFAGKALKWSLEGYDN